LTNVEIDPGLLTKAQAATHPSYEAYGYDAVGNQTVAVDADNRLTTSQYDGDNRAVQSVAASTAPTGTTTITTTTGYDPDGNSVAQTTRTSDSTSPGQVQTHTLTNAYNPADWETSTTDDGYTTNYGYDAAGQQHSETIVDGSTPVTMQLDAEGRVTAIGESYGGAGPYTSQYGYNADDLPTTITLPGGVTESAGYEANSELTSLAATGPNTGSPATTLNTVYGYGYNAAGWTTSSTTISGTDTIAHDGAGRITSDCGPQSIVRNTADHCYRWTYDANGNVTSQVADNGATEVYAYNPAQPNEVTQATFQQANVPAADQYKNVTTSYAYDGNGDTMAITSPVNGAYTDTAAINDHLQYDAEQRPITLTHLEGGVPITIVLGYNADGLRSRYTVAMSGTVVNDERFQYRDGELAQVSALRDAERAACDACFAAGTQVAMPHGDKPSRACMWATWCRPRTRRRARSRPRRCRPSSGQLTRIAPRDILTPMVDRRGDRAPSAQVVGLYTAARAGAPLQPRAWVEVVPGVGISGDRYATRLGHWSDPRWPHQVMTLVEGEVAEELAVDAGQLRRNIVTRGVRLNDLIGLTFQLGGAQFVGVRRCDPCRYLDSLTRPGLGHALRERGGLRAHILQGGRIHVADRMTMAPSPRVGGHEGMTADDQALDRAMKISR